MIVSTTTASVTESFGKESPVVTLKLVVVTDVPLAFPKLRRVEMLALVEVREVNVDSAKEVLVVKVMAPLASCMNDVPVTEVAFM